jgi:uncharacterized protein YjiS (DUF1127 family)
MFQLNRYYTRSNVLAQQHLQQEAVVSAIPALGLPRQRSHRFTDFYEALLHRAVILGFLIAREIRIRRDMRKLAEMDDWMLRDIGLARTEIEPATRHGRRALGSPAPSGRSVVVRESGRDRPLP